ncbi:MAG: DUF4410 domain-containing protein [Candidatus Binataceae bacterium]
MGIKLNRICVLLTVALAGCAGASATQQATMAPAVSARPTQIVVYPFSVDPSDVTLNQSIIQRAYRNVSGEDESAQQLKIAHDTAENVCLEVVTALKEKGYDAVCQKRGITVAGDNVVIVDGDFTDISEGNRLRRLVIGLGAGASTLDTSVEVWQRSGDMSSRLLAFTTHADSGKMPGAAVMGPAGAAAGAGAASVVVANAAAGGVKNYTSSNGFLADKTATQIVDSLTQYFAQHGWTS